MAEEPGWILRREIEYPFDPADLFDDYPNLITVRMHHGGAFTRPPRRNYENGNVDYVDLVNTEELNANEFRLMALALGYDRDEIRFYHFLVPQTDLDTGLRGLGTDQDVLNLLNYAPAIKLIDVFVEHGRTNLSTPNQSMDHVIHSFDPFLGLNSELPEQGPNENLQQGTQLNNRVNQVEDPFPNVDLNTVHINNGEDLNQGSGIQGDAESHNSNDFDDLFGVDVDMDSFGFGVNAEGSESQNVDGDIDPFEIDNFESEDENGSVIIKGRRDTQCNEVSFYLGQTFGNKSTIISLIKQHSLKTRRDIVVVKNDSTRVRAVCRGCMPNKKEPSGPSKGRKGVWKKSNGPGCPWVLYVGISKTEETWTVKTYFDTHKCFQTREVGMATAQYLSRFITEQIKIDPNMPLKAIQSHLSEKLEIFVSPGKAMRAKQMAMKQIWGDYGAQYNHLRDYLSEVKRCNPDTTVKIEVEQEPNPASHTRKFKRVYICLGALKRGFRAGRRDLLGIDGTFMKGPFPRQILTAVGIDPNQGIYPVAYAVVEAENTDSWMWFLECLADDLDLQRDSNFTFISDKQKGILPAICNVFPSAEHRYCLRHIHENMKQHWKGKAYKDHLWQCATAPTVPQFKTAMERLRLFNSDCYTWLNKIPPESWSRSHFTGRSHADVLLNNMCEVFNRQIVDARDKPIYSCLEYIRVYLMKRIVNVCKVIASCDGLLTPTATKVLEASKKDAAKFQVLFNGGDRYQVSGPWNDQCIVDVRARTCSCRRWELTGIPCKHDVATNWNMSSNGMPVAPEEWVIDLYKLTTWREMYNFKIEPINGSMLWERIDCPTMLTPPTYHKQVGRPRKKRKKTGEEMSQSQRSGETGKLPRRGKTVTCDKCKNK